MGVFFFIFTVKNLLIQNLIQQVNFDFMKIRCLCILFKQKKGGHQKLIVKNDSLVLLL